MVRVVADTITTSGNVSITNIASGTIISQDTTSGTTNNTTNVSGTSNSSEVDGNILLNGVDKYYKHTQATPSNHWVINHKLNKYPSISVVDSANTMFIS